MNSVADAEKIAEVGKYMPVGQRGVANTAGSGFWFEDYAAHGLEKLFRDGEQGIHAHTAVRDSGLPGAYRGES